MCSCVRTYVAGAAATPRVSEKRAVVVGLGSFVAKRCRSCGRGTRFEWYPLSFRVNMYMLQCGFNCNADLHFTTTTTTITTRARVCVCVCVCVCVSLCVIDAFCMPLTALEMSIF